MFFPPKISKAENACQTLTNARGAFGDMGVAVYRIDAKARQRKPCAMPLKASFFKTGKFSGGFSI